MITDNAPIVASLTRFEIKRRHDEFVASPSQSLAGLLPPSFGHVCAWIPKLQTFVQIPAGRSCALDTIRFFADGIRFATGPTKGRISRGVSWGQRMTCR